MPQRHHATRTHGSRAERQHSAPQHRQTLLQQYMAVGRFFLNEARIGLVLWWRSRNSPSPRKRSLF
jgi:hypothetical protein